MSKQVVVTARIDADLGARLAELAAAQDRSRSSVAERAIRRYVAEELAYCAFVQSGVDSADRGELISQEQMEEWFEARHRQIAAE